MRSYPSGLFSLGSAVASMAMAGALAACSGVPGSSTSFSAPAPNQRDLSRMTLDVPSTQAYTDSGVAVAGGQRLHFSATGKTQWRLDCNGRCLKRPGGIPYTKRRCKRLQESQEFGQFTAPGLACFSLIGKVGSDGAPFEIGGLLSYVVPTSDSGELYLGFNDNRYQDNSGSFSVKIQY